MELRYFVSVLDLHSGPAFADVTINDFVRVNEDLLTPKEMGVHFGGNIFQRETADREEILLGGIKGLVMLREGAASIHQLEIDCSNMNPIDPTDTAPTATITSNFLERVPIADIGLTVAAKCSLTRWQDAHYAIQPVPHMKNPTSILDKVEAPFRYLDALKYGKPVPVSRPPKPVVIDEDGVPWYRVQVYEEINRILSRQKRARVTPDFLRDVWTAYTSAQQAGEPTTQSIREWAEARNGRAPSNPTIFRWIKEARVLYGEGQTNA